MLRQFIRGVISALLYCLFILILTIVVLYILLFIVHNALAHDANGEPNWIATGRYQGKDGIHCCGRADCEMLSDGEVESRPGGYYLTRFKEFVPFSESPPSEDGKYWRCHTYSGERRCFFSATGGS